MHLKPVAFLFCYLVLFASSGHDISLHCAENLHLSFGFRTCSWKECFVLYQKVQNVHHEDAVLGSGTVLHDDHDCTRLYECNDLAMIYMFAIFPWARLMREKVSMTQIDWLLFLSFFLPGILAAPFEELV